MIKTEQKKKRRGAYYRCLTCGDEFYVFPSYIKKMELLGKTPKYCSAKCYIKVGENNPNYGKKLSGEELERVRGLALKNKFKKGNENPNFKRFGEEYGFKGSRLGWWQRKLKKEIGKCEICGFSDTRILETHHKDRNTKNNVKENLMLLCKNCHALLHYKDKDGPYWKMSND